MFQNPEQVLLIASVILFLSIFAGKAGYRFGLPALLLFLGVGMLFGSDGLGKFTFVLGEFGGCSVYNCMYIAIFACYYYEEESFS